MFVYQKHCVFAHLIRHVGVLSCFLFGGWWGRETSSESSFLEIVCLINKVPPTYRSICFRWVNVREKLSLRR